jgi:hypothetical protein
MNLDGIMGRRSIANLTPQEIRKQAAKAFRNVVHASSVNLVQFEAQIVEAEMVNIIIGFARDTEMPPGFRKECAKDVIQYARGPQAPWFHDGKTINPAEIGRSGVTIEAEIDAAKMTGDLYQKLDELVRMNIPLADWPDEIRLMAGDLVNVFDADDDG